MEGYEAYFPYVFAAFFVGMWLLVGRIIAWVSGWGDMAELYECTRKPDGKAFNFQSARINSAGYNNALNMVVSEQGLYIVPFFLFRSFHKPLLIPWTDFDVKEEKVFFIKRYRLKLKTLPNQRIDLSARTFDRMMMSLREMTGLDIKMNNDEIGAEKL